MSSKMRAGLIAGGFFVGFTAIAIGLLNIVPSLAVALSALVDLLAIFGLGIVSGVMAANWLEPEDYGDQFAAGGFAGAIASLVVQAGNLGITGLLFLILHKPNPTDAYTQLNLSQNLSLTGQSVVIIIQVVVRVLLLLVYMVIALLISGATTRIVAAGKSLEALQRMMEAREARAKQRAGQGGALYDEPEEMIDPALLAYRTPEYSPFVDDPQQRVVISPWQRRRLEKEGKMRPPQDDLSDEYGEPRGRQQGPGPVYRVEPPPRWRRPTQR